MSEKERDRFREITETQFRNKFYSDVQFPYLQSIGIKDVFQGFELEEQGFIGIMHLWYEGKVWRSEWLDTTRQGMEIIKKLMKEKLYNEQKLIYSTQRYIQGVLNKVQKRNKPNRSPTKKGEVAIVWN